MAEGKVRKIVAEKGFGFIRPDEGGADLFFHNSSLVEIAIEELETGDAVSFQIEDGREGKGPRAVRVTRL